MVDILGLRDEPRASAEELLALALGFYQEAKAAKAYDKVDQIRSRPQNPGHRDKRHQNRRGVGVQ
ncbi:MAG: hypothetical protein WKG07_03495 [Hymenobacter sp.]